MEGCYTGLHLMVDMGECYCKFKLKDMENKNKPAYPVRGANGVPINFDGFPWEQMGVSLTKRELMAAMAMQGILTGITTQLNNNDYPFSVGAKRKERLELSITEVAKISILQADELLNQLENK